MQKGTGPVDVAMLGDFRVRVDGREITDGAWTGRRSKELVQLLALAENHALARDKVIDALWPHLDANAGAANLRKAAHHARQAFDNGDAIILKGGMVQLSPSRPVSTDVERFSRAAEAALSADDADACTRAAAMYGGELLPGSLYEDWTASERDRVRSKYLALLRCSGRWAQVVELDPIDEAAYQSLMRNALAAGRRADAIRWYGKLRGALARELGVSPNAESERLYNTCVDGLEAVPSPFVGRDVELATVTALLRQRGAVRANTIVVKGVAGIGKSAFAREVALLAPREGWLCVSLEATGLAEPYGPMCAAIEELLVDSSEMVEALGESGRATLATLTELGGPATPPDGQLSRHQVVGAFRRLLLVASGGRPVLVILDDAHLADNATVDALVQLTSSGGPVAVVFSLRPEPPHPALERALSRLDRAERLTAIELEALDASDSRILVHHARENLAADVVERIVTLAAGNPFVLLELTRSTGSGELGTLPRDLPSAITARLVDLDDATIELLRRIALASDDIDSASVTALIGGDEERAFMVLDRALDAGVLVVADGRYRFRHDLVRQALVEEVPPHQRVAVHRDAARRLAALDAPPSVVAAHWLAGNRPDEAIPFLLAAGRRAMTVGAFADALHFFDQLLDHHSRHAAARRLRAETLDFMGDIRTVNAYDDAIEVCEHEELHDLQAKRALAQLKQGDPVGALRSLDGVEPTTVEGRLAEALTFSGAAALGFIDPATGTAKSAEVRRAALQSGDAAAIVVASWSQAAAAHARGELRESVLTDLRDTSALPHLATRVFDGQLCVTQRLLYGARPYADVIEFADSLTAEATRLGAARGIAFGVVLRGEAELLSGDLDAAERDLRRAAQLHRAIAGATGEALAIQRLSELAMYRGRHGDAIALLDEALDLARSTDIGFHLLDRIYGTRITLARDPTHALAVVEEAEEAVRGTLETCPGCRITFAVPAAIACARAGDAVRSAEYAQASEFLAEVVMRLPAWLAALAEVRGHLARSDNDINSATDHFSAAATGFRMAGHPLDAARCDELSARS